MVTTKSTHNPLVTIVIPVYNGEKYMREAIDSALSQTYPNIEIIVVNDGSEDSTESIALSYGDKIKYFAKENGGVSTALNLAIANMQGEYFSWLSHDDVYALDKVATAIDALREKNLLGKKVIVYSDYRLIDAKSKCLTDVIINHSLADDKRIYALTRGLINGNSLLIPKKAFEKYGKFNEKLLCTQDYDLWFKMSQEYEFLHIPKITIDSRYHSGQSTFTNPKVQSEGNALWLRIIKSFSKTQQIKLNGSVYAFYYHFIEYLTKTPYDEALAYCETELSKIEKEQIVSETYISYSNEKIFSGNKLKRTMQLVRREGLAPTLNKIKKRLWEF